MAAKKSTKLNKSTKPIGPIKKGTLHTAMGIKQSKPIPSGELDTIANAKIGNTVNVGKKKMKVTTTVKKKAVFAQNAKKFNHSK
jgi:hypothetical protein